MLVGAQGTGAGVSSNVAGNVGGDTKESVQACCVPDGQEVGAEQKSGQEKSHADPLDDVVGAEEAKWHVVDISALSIGGDRSLGIRKRGELRRENLSARLIFARNEAIEIGVHVDD